MTKTHIQWYGDRSNKTKLPTNKITMNGQRCVIVTSFKYLVSVITNEGSTKPELLSRIADTTTALIRLKSVWISKSTRVFHLTPMYKLICPIVTFISLNAYESCPPPLTTELQRIQIMEMETLL